MRLAWIALLCLPALAQEDDLVAGLLEMEAPPRPWKDDPVVKAFGVLARPADDAPLEELLDYWELHRDRSPSPEVQRRLLATCRASPRMIPVLLYLLPRTEETRRLVAGSREWAELEKPWHASAIEEWLEDEEADETDLEYLAQSDLPRAREAAARQAEGDDPVQAAAALAFLHGRAEGAERERLRDRLRDIAADSDAGLDARNDALRALASDRWDGRDEWVLTLFAEEGLALSAFASDDPDGMVPVLTDLLADDNPVVRDHAVQGLILFQLHQARADALRPLLPWLLDPTWAREHDRDRLCLVQSVARVDLPECAEGLLHVLAHETDETILEAAFEAVAHYRVTRAAPLVRRRYDAGAREWQVLEAALRCGALRREEMVSAVMAAARARAQGRAGENGWDRFSEFTPEEELGWHLVFRPPEDEEVAVAVLEEASRVPEAAWIVHRWGGRVADRDIVARLPEGTLPAASLRQALERREEVAEHAGDALRDLMREGRGAARGVAAALLGQPGPVLDSGDLDAQRALLACARLVLMPLDEEKVARRLPDAAAAAYLEAIDTPAARRLLPPGRIAGWMGWPGEEEPPRWFEQGSAPREVWSLSTSTEDGLRRIAVLVFEERMEVWWSDDPARWCTRPLAEEECRALVDFLRKHRVDDLPPIPLLADDGESHTYYHLTPGGGCRVFMDDPDVEEGTDLYQVLAHRFERLIRRGRFETRYAIAEREKEMVRLAGGGIQAVWARGDDVRVLRDDWRALDGKPADEPEKSCDLVFNAFWSLADWEAGLGGGRKLCLRGGRKLWVESEAGVTVLHEGECGMGVLSPDRRWLVMAFVEGNRGWIEPNGLLRIDLSTPAVHPVDLPRLDENSPVAWIPAHGKVLVHREDGERDVSVLLDPATGDTTPVNGVVWPLFGFPKRALQPTGRPNEYWAARPAGDGTDVGRFDARAFTFTVVRRVPCLRFWTHDLWIDGEWAYVVYEGDLLRLPLEAR